MAETIKLTRKMDRMYRVGLPEDLRRHLDIEVGDYVDFIMDTEKKYVTLRKQEVAEDYEEITE